MSNKYHTEPRVGLWIAGITITVIILLIFLHTKNSKPQPAHSSKTNREIALLCTTDMATEFHIHPTLKIIINKENIDLPKNIGVGPVCMNSLHTHDNDNTIHVESPEKRDFNLSDFFAVWGKTFNKNQILDYKTDDKHTIRVTINGKEVQTYENTILRDQDKIVIYYE